jgi:peptidoglycan/xylan/chitin deacetylase (PgdA/CDA1 family)
MERVLLQNEIEYILKHLGWHYSGFNPEPFLIFFQGGKLDTVPGSPKIYMPQSSQGPNPDNPILINNLPVLFSCSDKTNWYTIDDTSIYFHHDLIKCAFYLLSGYQEYEFREMDAWGRFPWNKSIQYKLGFTHKPLVNYYFEILLEAFEKFSEINEFDFKSNNPRPPLLFLSHDVDRIKKYSLRELAYIVLLILGIKKSNLKQNQLWPQLKDQIKGLLQLKKDPYWNFEELISLEASLGIHSTWYMLEKQGRNNSRYHFHKRKIKKLIHKLEEDGHEIGIHGTLASSTNKHVMEDGLGRLSTVSQREITGNRQHYLKFSHPLTTNILNDSGINYDATLGFAEQIGFRNSYTFPFHLYNFETNEAYQIWQIPLNVMDVSLSGYLNLEQNLFYTTIEPLLKEVEYFGGVFSILWHNCNLDESLNKGINRTYREILSNILKRGLIARNGREIIDEFKISGV